MAAGKARKSTHQKKQSKSTKTPKVIEIDAKAKYEIDQIGPVHLVWGKRRTKTKKGKIVKEWYIKKTSKQLIWVKWKEPFQDEHEKDDAYLTSWSAEDQKILLENSANKAAVEKALDSKVVWPWISNKDEASEDRIKLLKKGGYRVWKAAGKAAKSSQKWTMKFPIQTETDTGTTSSGSDSESTSATDNAEEEDEV